MAGSVAAAPRRRASHWAQGLACGVVATLATPTAVLAGLLLAPAVLTYMLDTRDGRALTRTVLLAGLAAAAQPLTTLWGGGHTMDLALRLVADPSHFGLAWAAQGVGWLLAEALPLAITASYNVQTAARAARLRAARAALEHEWSLPPPATVADVSAQPSG
jgi:hypothetical protein